MATPHFATGALAAIRRGLATAHGYTDLMDVTKLPTGKAPPSDINVVIEIPQG